MRVLLGLWKVIFYEKMTTVFLFSSKMDDTPASTVHQLVRSTGRLAPPAPILGLGEIISIQNTNADAACASQRKLQVLDVLVAQLLVTNIPAVSLQLLYQPQDGHMTCCICSINLDYVDVCRMFWTGASAGGHMHDQGAENNLGSLLPDGSSARREVLNTHVEDFGVLAGL
jgi:hypothetical protein